MNTRRVIIVLVFFALIIFTITIGALKRNKSAMLNQQKKQTGALVVVATTYPLYDFTRMVTDNAPNVMVKNLLPLNVKPHDFTPTPEITATLAETNVVHIWLDPQNAIIQVERIRDALIAVNPENKNIYEQNAGRYMALLNQLDNDYEMTIKNTGQKKFISYHSAFRYLAKRYGLAEVATIVAAPDKEPSAREIAALTRIIKDQKIKVIFSEPQISPRIVETLAADLGLKILNLDPIETGGEDDSYLAIMRRNLEILKNELR
ncbi:MAG: Periplasmic solute binding family protein [Parcubacteria group bacterium GW2011_GWA2_46_9]|nr:MAG: Periplasmic solute binding family protein [Parcubacteria group bacterium GW2011_GWA2_46_9]